jgi:hypothetical protein
MLDPSTLWDDITGFMSSRFMMRTSAVSVHTIKLSPVSGRSQKHQALFTVSKASRDLKYLGIVTMWPSK